MTGPGLVELTRDLVAQTGLVTPNVNQAWHHAASELLSDHPADEVEAVVRFSQEDKFWRKHCFSLPYIKNKYDTLLGQVANKGVKVAKSSLAKAREAKLRATMERAFTCDGHALTPDEIEETVRFQMAKYC